MLFVGQLAPSWSRVPASQRYVVAKTLVARLTEAGVGDVMLYGDYYPLEIHATSGSLKQPTRPK